MYVVTLISQIEVMGCSGETTSKLQNVLLNERTLKIFGHLILCRT